MLRRLGFRSTLGFQASPIFSTIRRYASMPEKALMLLPPPPEKELPEKAPPETEKAPIHSCTMLRSPPPELLMFYHSYMQPPAPELLMVYRSYMQPPPESEKALMVMANDSTGYSDDESLMREALLKYFNLFNSRWTKLTPGDFITLPLLTRPVFPENFKEFTNISSHIPTQGYLILELVMVVCPGDKLLNGKGLFTGFVVEGHVSNIRRYFKLREKKTKIAESLALQEVANLSQEDKNLFTTVWRSLHPKKPDDNDQTYWVYQAVTHSYYSFTEQVHDYIYRTGHLFVRFLGGGRDDITAILRDLGYRPGFFYEAKEFKDKVSERLGVMIYPVFLLNDGIPCLQYIVLALDRQEKLMSHPTAPLLGRGMFLFQRW